MGGSQLSHQENEVNNEPSSTLATPEQTTPHKLFFQIMSL